MSYANPTVPIPPNAVFVDEAIGIIQAKLATLPWLTHSFGRSYIGKMQRGGNKEFKAPYVYSESGEYYPVEFNDNLQAQSFFEVGEQTPANTWESRVLNWYNVDLGIIFWVNLKRIDGPKGVNYYFTEELKKDVRDLFRLDPTLNISIESIQEDIDEIFSKYSFSQSNDKQYFLFPYAAFKFNVKLLIAEKC